MAVNPSTKNPAIQGMAQGNGKNQYNDQAEAEVERGRSITEKGEALQKSDQARYDREWAEIEKRKQELRPALSPQAARDLAAKNLDPKASP